MKYQTPSYKLNSTMLVINKSNFELEKASITPWTWTLVLLTKINDWIIFLG